MPTHLIFGPSIEPVRLDATPDTGQGNGPALASRVPDRLTAPQPTFDRLDALSATVRSRECGGLTARMTFAVDDRDLVRRMHHTPDERIVRVRVAAPGDTDVSADSRRKA